jgi:hypothetical protein
MSSAIVAKDLGTLPLIVLKNSTIIVRKQGISSKIVPSGLQRNMKLLIISVGPSNAPSTGQSSITPKMVQQIIVSTLSTLCLSGNKNSIPKPRYFDYAASNHMTNIALPLNNVQKYKGDLQIRTADGNPLPITAVGDISTLLNIVFVSPKLSTNLISVVNLVDNNCDVHFSNSVILCKIKCHVRENDCEGI